MLGEWTAESVGESDQMKIERAWAMPNKNTFSIKPIGEFIAKQINDYASSDEITIIDPFDNSNKFATITNDLDMDMLTDYHLDAIDFLKMFDDDSVDIVLYDPPYSPRQVSECYKKLGKTVNMKTTQSSYWSNQKNEISRIEKTSGRVLSFGWNSVGIGINRGFEINEILIVCHGGYHNDTICTSEFKTPKLF